MKINLISDFGCSAKCQRSSVVFFTPKVQHFSFTFFIYWWINNRRTRCSLLKLILIWWLFAVESCLITFDGIVFFVGAFDFIILFAFEWSIFYYFDSALLQIQASFSSQFKYPSRNSTIFSMCIYQLLINWTSHISSIACCVMESDSRISSSTQLIKSLLCAEIF